ncbi:MAG: preprotein translocase subunit SecE [Candidatus Methylacidiphilales bacterium]|nr:preprotein translocase subunit SecE [Candidatus Methylacidiphilales bacterium]
MAVIFGGVALLIAAFVWVKYGVYLRKFNREVWAELQKCVWPWDPEQKGMKKYRELRDSTLVVVVSTLLLAAYVTGMDLVLNTIVGLLTRYH